MPPDIPQVIISKENGEALVAALTEKKAVGVTLSESSTDEVALWKTANLYTSGISGDQYTVALKDVNYRQGTGSTPGFADVHKVESVDGTYVEPRPG